MNADGDMSLQRLAEQIIAGDDGLGAHFKYEGIVCHEFS